MSDDRPEITDAEILSEMVAEMVEDIDRQAFRIRWTTGVTLPRDQDENEWGTAERLAAHLTSPERPITAALIRKWAWRSRRPGDKLYGMLPGRHIPGARTGETWYRLIDGAQVELATSKDPVRSREH